MKKTVLLLFTFLSLTVSFAQEKFVEVGTATFYADYLNGRTTASGEVFSQKELTTAHKTLAFGSLVKLTNLVNGKSVVLRVNDRGPYQDGRIVDVSKAAAEKLDFIMEGHVNVKLELLNKNNNNPLDSLRESSDVKTKDQVRYIDSNIPYYRLISKIHKPKGYGLQLGCYSDVENVITFSNKVRNLTRMPVFVTCTKNGSENVYKVFAGEISTEDKARALKNHVEQLFKGVFIVKY